MENKSIVSGKIANLSEDHVARIRPVAKAVLDGKTVAECEIAKDGSFELPLKKPMPVEIKVTPKGNDEIHLAKRNISELAFKKDRAEMVLATDTKLLDRMIFLLGTTYRIYGTVYSGTVSPLALDPLAGVRIDFYEYDPAGILFPFPTTESKEFLGSAYTNQVGEYDFDFFLPIRLAYWYLFPMMDRTPDIRVEIMQFHNGNWVKVFEQTNTDWNIDTEFHRDYLIPEGDVIPQPPGGSFPDSGFKPISVGLLPTTRLDKGYATAVAGDPSRVRNIHNQPLAGNLRLFGLFAAAPPVATYKVQIATANEDGPTGSWSDLTDPLINRQWDAADSDFKPITLGPDENNHYQNIDTLPEADWHEHSLKFTWNSTNHPDGYYCLKVTGYAADNSEVCEQELPVMRIDNTAPQVSVEAVETIDGTVDDCGVLFLPDAPPHDRWIRFNVQAYHPQGHLLKYELRGSLGKNAVSAGSTIVRSRPNPDQPWNGEYSGTENFRVVSTICDPVAANFELWAWGAGTDCYAHMINPQIVRDETNLVVSES